MPIKIVNKPYKKYRYHKIKMANPHCIVLVLVKLHNNNIIDTA